MYKIDLHTHSVASPDGGLRARHYHKMLQAGGLDVVAITDHNSLDFAQKMQAELGARIIVGEEVTTTEGEIIGLFLTKPVPANLGLAEAVQAIRAQHGLVYVPHPFETVRKGLSASALDSIAGEVDIIEVHNGRAIFQNEGAAAAEWARLHHVPGAASSDAHGWRGWGRTYSQLNELPTRETLVTLLEQAAHLPGTVGLAGALYPKLQRLGKRFGR